MRAVGSGGADGRPDWDLLAVAAQDPRALTVLFQRHRDYVFRVAWGLLGERAAAEDVVQEVFLRLQSGRLRARPRARFTTWLYRVALNTAREQARKRRRLWGGVWGGVWGDGPGQTAIPDMPDSLTDPARLDRLKDLSRALAALPQRQREVVVLRFLEGFDTAETAEILGCRAGTVKAHLHRATGRLRDFLSHQPQEETEDEKTDDRGRDGRERRRRHAGGSGR